jgi:hypothetical protein
MTGEKLLLKLAEPAIRAWMAEGIATHLWIEKRTESGIIS